MSNAIPEPENNTIVAWYQSSGELYVVLQRDDASAEQEQVNSANDKRWFFPCFDETEDPRSWTEACTELDGFPGPVVLVPAQDKAVSA